jgi:hypothetical protein
MHGGTHSVGKIPLFLKPPPHDKNRLPVHFGYVDPKKDIVVEDGKHGEKQVTSPANEGETDSRQIRERRPSHPFNRMSYWYRYDIRIHYSKRRRTTITGTLNFTILYLLFIALDPARGTRR